MPALYWLPLPGLADVPDPAHLHAAFSAWFDGERDSEDHRATVKPYRLSPGSVRDGQWGLELSILTAEAYVALSERLAAGEGVRIGRHATRVGPPKVLRGATWDELAAWPGETGWQVEFLTPFLSRTGNRSSPYPTPAVVLRAPTEAWAAYSGLPGLRLSTDDQRHLWVSDMNLHTTTVHVNGHRYRGGLGRLTFRCDSDAVAHIASSLFRLAVYTGMGSFRVKGFGVVGVTLQR